MNMRSLDDPEQIRDPFAAKDKVKKQEQVKNQVEVEMRKSDVRDVRVPIDCNC